MRVQVLAQEYKAVFLIAKPHLRQLRVPFCHCSQFDAFWFWTDELTLFIEKLIYILLEFEKMKS